MKNDLFWIDEIPSDVAVAAEKVSHWFQKQGIKNWEFLGLADRDTVANLRCRLRDTKRYLRAANKGAERNAIALQLCSERNSRLHDRLNVEMRRP